MKVLLPFDPAQINLVTKYVLYGFVTLLTFLFFITLSSGWVIRKQKIKRITPSIDFHQKTGRFTFWMLVALIPLLETSTHCIMTVHLVYDALFWVHLPCALVSLIGTGVLCYKYTGIKAPALHGFIGSITAFAFGATVMTGFALIYRL
jgi:hypothetical protein